MRDHSPVREAAAGLAAGAPMLNDTDRQRSTDLVHHENPMGADDSTAGEELSGFELMKLKAAQKKEEYEKNKAAKRRLQLELLVSATDEECEAAEEVVAAQKAADAEAKKAAKEAAKAEKALVAENKKATKRRARLGLPESATDEECDTAEKAEAAEKAAGGASAVVLISELVSMP